MSVKINVHYFLPHLTSDQEIVEVDGGTIGECIEQLATRFPKSREWLFREDGNLGNAIDVYINKESLQSEKLSKPVKNGDEIFIVMMISGG